MEDEPRFAKDHRGFGTRAVQAGSPHDPVTGAVISPVSLPPPPLPPIPFTTKTNKQTKETKLIISTDLSLHHLRTDICRLPRRSL